MAAYRGIGVRQGSKNTAVHCTVCQGGNLSNASHLEIISNSDTVVMCLDTVRWERK